MTCTFNKKQIGLAVSCALALGIGAGTASAQNAQNNGYVTDQRNAVVKSGFGLCWRTGYWTPGQANAECDPELMPKTMAAAEPAPAPASPPAAMAKPAAPQPVAGKVTLDADALFDFDKAVLRPAGRTSLDEFVGKLRDMNAEVITAVGHTDRFGSEAYNQKLSEQRVAAVKTYLVGKGIEPNRISTAGKGEMQPVTKADECPGAKSAKVITCLQPDRRVNIEFVGTQAATK